MNAPNLPASNGHAADAMKIAGDKARANADFNGRSNNPDADPLSHLPAMTDVGNGQRLRTRHGANFRYCHAMGKHLVWRPPLWRFDTSDRVVQMAKEAARSGLKDAADIEDPHARRKVIEWVKYSERARSIDAAIRLAGSEPGIPISPDEMDADSMLFGHAGGVIDLRTGIAREARREDYLTIASPVACATAAHCPLWLAFLERVMAGNAALIAYVKRIAGLCLTGDISVQELFILFGSGANGKSVFVDTLLYILGDYATVAPDSLLTVRSNNEHATEMADLHRRRAVFASETEDGAKLKVQKVKQLTGDAVLKGRLMRCDFMSFRRTHKLLIVSNHLPRIGDTGHAIWRRVKVIPFTVTIPLEERDTELLEKLKAEAPGILRWCVDGCLDWQRGGMRPPAEVELATETYRTESDPLADYLADRTVRGGSNVKVSRGDLYADYSSWTAQAGEKFPLDNRAFYDAIRRLDAVADAQWKPLGSNVPVRGFTGIGLVRVGATQNDEPAFSSREGGW